MKEVTIVMLFCHILSPPRELRFPNGTPRHTIGHVPLAAVTAVPLLPARDAPPQLDTLVSARAALP
jgi:hypothetical protein